MPSSYDETLVNLRAVMRSIRSETAAVNVPRDRAASSDIRIGYVNGRPVKRLVITLRGPGCGWVLRGGGCTMCGHYAGTTHGLPASVADTITQFTEELNRYRQDDIEVLSIYNSGSVFNPEEIEFEALAGICRHVRNMPTVRKVVFETRAEYAHPDTIRALAKELGPGKRISVAIGLETADDMKRELCMNKGCSLDFIRRIVTALKGIADIQLYVLCGLPFLTETETIDDTVNSIYCARDLGADEIHIEPATLQRHSLASLLADAGLYRLPSLYTLYEILKTVVPGIRPYVSPFLHMPLPERIPEGCPVCTSRLIQGLLNRYNIHRDRASLDYDPCECMEHWRARLDECDERPLEKRVSDAMSILAEAASV